MATQQTEYLVDISCGNVSHFMQYQKIILSPEIYSLYRTMYQVLTLNRYAVIKCSPSYYLVYHKSRGQSGVWGYCYTSGRTRSASFMLRNALFPIS